MKVVYITSPAFFDADLSFVNELRRTVELTVLMDLPSFALKTTALNIERQPKQAGIYHISEIDEFQKYAEFLGQNCFVINRPAARRFSVETFAINRKLKHFLTELKPDLIHLNNPITQFGKSVLKFPAKKIMTIHDPIPHIGEHPGNLKIRNWNMKYVKNYLLLNEFQKDAFISNYNLDANQVHTSFLSVFNFYKSLKKELEVNSSEEFNLLFFGRITPYKGIDVLVQTFNQLKSVYPQLKLTIAGKGELPVSIKDLDGITLVNKHVLVEELAELINHSNLVICPYIEGTQSGVIMTSFAFSKPVVATKVGGFHEMIVDDFTGFLVEPKSVESLKTKLIEIIEKPQILHDVSKNITSTYYQNGDRSWKASVEKTLGIYQTIVEKNGF